MLLSDQCKKRCLVFDIETSSICNISNINKYIENAKIKWIGFYSYITEKYYEIPVSGNEKYILDFIAKHDTLIGFNSEQFDIPILRNNNLLPDKYFNSIDIQKILGNRIYLGHKNRGALMGYKFKSNSLKQMAVDMNLELIKGEINYKIFEKESWTEYEENQIKYYLRTDICLTKDIFEKLVQFWLPFTEMISEDNVRKWRWLTTSIASLTYQYACNVMGWKEEYSEETGKKETGGGRVLQPKLPEAVGVWYIDVRSLYPHIYAMFNLFAETTNTDNNEKEYPVNSIIWHGNSIFKVSGYYDISNPHTLCIDIMEKLRKRIELKQLNPNNPAAYAYKILLNSLYGANRSPIFKSLYTPNSGKDCCSLGRQINEIIEKKMIDFEFEVLAGDTDSLFIKSRKVISDEKQYVQECIKKIVSYINQHVPYPQPTFDIEIEAYCNYIMWNYDTKKKHYKKKNYMYISDNKLKVMGMAIIRSDCTELGKKIFELYLKPKILETNKGKYDTNWIKNLIHIELTTDPFLMAKEYNCHPSKDYKSRINKHDEEVISNYLNAQISRKYFNGQDGKITLIKNRRIGDIGCSKKWKYCTVDEAIKYNLKLDDLDLTKIYNELNPFCIEELK